jgi:hypothetical protein
MLAELIRANQPSIVNREPRRYDALAVRASAGKTLRPLCA